MRYLHFFSDTDMIKAYFQDSCYESVLKYSANVKILIDRVASWTDNKKSKFGLLTIYEPILISSIIGNELSIFLGRLTRNIALLSKELPKSLLISAETTPIFELRSRINKGELNLLGSYTKYTNYLF